MHFLNLKSKEESCNLFWHQLEGVDLWKQDNIKSKASFEHTIDTKITCSKQLFSVDLSESNQERTHVQVPT